MDYIDLIITEANNWLAKRDLTHIKLISLSEGSNGLMMWEHISTDQAKTAFDKSNEEELRQHLIEYSRKLGRDGNTEI